MRSLLSLPVVSPLFVLQPCRPFTEPMARAMLSGKGEVEGMWMPTIKTHAFVIYATQEQAEATLAATMDKEWPQGNHSRLVHALTHTFCKAACCSCCTSGIQVRWYNV